MQQTSQKEQSNTFRSDVSEYPEWSEQSKHLAGVIADIIESGAGNYDVDTFIVSLSVSKMQQLLANGELCAPDNALLYFMQFPDQEVLLTLVDEGLRVVLKRDDGQYIWVSGEPKFPHYPSVEEFLCS